MHTLHDRSITCFSAITSAPSTARSTLLLIVIGLLVVGAAHAQSGERAREMPADFVANRIYVEPVTATGDTLRLYTDTGGGQIILQPTFKQLQLPIRDTLVVRGRPTPVTELPDFRAEASVPPVRQGPIVVFPNGRRAQLMKMGDGMLGRGWFAGRVWTFDYAERQLLLHSSDQDLSFDPAHTVPLGFKTDSTGRRIRHFPSIEATIDGETHAFLFDSGASLILTDSAHAAFGGPPVQGTSFVVASLFEKWRSEHPDWRVVDNADRAGGGMPIIEVPEVTIAGHTVGPVWFTRRPDRNFHRSRTLAMDRRVDGALGGSLFQYFTITVDYPGARAVFHRAE